MEFHEEVENGIKKSKYGGDTTTCRCGTGVSVDHGHGGRRATIRNTPTWRNEGLHC